MEQTPKMVRLPVKLNDRLTREAGERTMKTGKRVSANQVIVEILERFFRGERPAAQKR